MDLKQQLTSKIEQDKAEMNSIPQEFYDIRYGWLQVIIGAAEHYHPFIREFLCKHGGNIYGKDISYSGFSFLKVGFLD